MTQQQCSICNEYFDTEELTHDDNLGWKKTIYKLENIGWVCDSCDTNLKRATELLEDYRTGRIYEYSAHDAYIEKEYLKREKQKEENRVKESKRLRIENIHNARKNTDLKQILTLLFIIFAIVISLYILISIIMP